MTENDPDKYVGYRYSPVAGFTCQCCASACDLIRGTPSYPNGVCDNCYQQRIATVMNAGYSPLRAPVSELEKALKAAMRQRDEALAELAGARAKICDLIGKFDSKKTCSSCRKCPRCRLEEIVKKGASPALALQASKLLDGCEGWTQPKIITWGKEPRVRVAWDAVSVVFEPGGVSVYRDVDQKMVALGPEWLGDALGAIDSVLHKQMPRQEPKRGLGAHVASGPACAFSQVVK